MLIHLAVNLSPHTEVATLLMHKHVFEKFILFFTIYQNLFVKLSGLDLESCATGISDKISQERRLEKKDRPTITCHQLRRINGRRVKRSVPGRSGLALVCNVIPQKIFCSGSHLRCDHNITPSLPICLSTRNKYDVTISCVMPMVWVPRNLIIITTYRFHSC